MARKPKSDENVQRDPELDRVPGGSGWLAKHLIDESEPRPEVAKMRTDPYRFIPTLQPIDPDA